VSKILLNGIRAFNGSQCKDPVMKETRENEKGWQSIKRVAEFRIN